MTGQIQAKLHEILEKVIILFYYLSQLLTMVKEKSNLPFEEESEKSGKSSKSPMKRIAVLIKPERVDGVISALRGLRLEATIDAAKGAGKEKERVTSGRGIGTIDLAYTTRKIIATVVDSGREDVVDAIRAELSGKGTGGVLVITPVDDVIHI